VSRIIVGTVAVIGHDAMVLVIGNLILPSSKSGFEQTAVQLIHKNGGR